MNAPPDDTLLSAWLDGELTPEQRTEVEAWLHEHPEDAARVRAWGADARALRAALDGVLDEPVPPALTAAVSRRSPAVPGRFAAARSPAWWRAAAGLAIFLLGGAVGAAMMWRVQRAQLSAIVATTPATASALGGAWVQRAAVAHSVYVPEVRHPVEVRAQEEHLSRWLTRRCNVPVKLFDLREQGFELVGGRLLPDASGPSAQLMYEAIAPAGAGDASAVAAAAPKPVRVTVYLRKPDDATPAAFRYERHGELGLFYWVEGKSASGGPTGYALVGALPREKLLALAEAIYRQEPGQLSGSPSGSPSGPQPTRETGR
jgi:anti-sigma factor RsiW